MSPRESWPAECTRAVTVSLRVERAPAVATARSNAAASGTSRRMGAQPTGGAGAPRTASRGPRALGGGSLHRTGGTVRSLTPFSALAEEGQRAASSQGVHATLDAGPDLLVDVADVGVVLGPRGIRVEFDRVLEGGSDLGRQG